MNKPWVTWLLVCLGLLGGAIAFYLIAPISGAPQAVRAGAVVFDVAVAAWIYYGLWCWRDRRWVQSVSLVVIAFTVVAVFNAICIPLGATRAAYSASGIYVMTAILTLGLALARVLFRPGLPMLGVARTFLDEAVRMKLALLFIIVLLLVIPILPMVNPNERLSYRVASTLSWSMMITSVLLSLMTIFACCGTICSELSNKQIYLTMTKPVSRWQYLVGKWLGICVLNAVLLGVAGTGIYTYARVLALTPITATNKAEEVDAELDRQHIQDYILTGRESAYPALPPRSELEAAYQERLANLRKDNPDLYAPPISRELRAEIEAPIEERAFAIGPMHMKRFEFKGLDRARQFGDTVTLRVKPRAFRPPTNDTLLLRFDTRVAGYIRKPAHNKVFNLDLNDLDKIVDPDGTLIVQIANGNQTTVRFAPGEGMEVLYKTSSFEFNLFKSMAVIWLKLCFLAALALALGTFLNFPLAAMVACVIYFSSAGSAYITESLDNYASYGIADDADVFGQISGFLGGMWNAILDGDGEKVFKGFIKFVGSFFMLIVPPLGDFDPTPFLTEGRNVPPAMVKDAAWKLGLVWTGLMGVIGYAIFRRRELARVTV